MSPSDSISVIVATWNRQAILAETLEHLHRQTVPSRQWEVIVVDDGSTDGTDQMVAEAREQCWGFPLRYIWHENRGPGFTQNVGIQQACHELILLLADDIWTHPELLAEHLRSHRQYPDSCIAVLGNVRTSPRLPPTALHRVWNPFHYERFHGRTEVEGYFFHACNLSAKRSFLLEHGLFRERQAAAHEDIELGYRLSQQGLRIVFNERALADHYHPETLANICRRAYERGYHFDLLTESLPGPLVYPLYKVLSRDAGWPAFLKMLPRECARRIAFNHLTVRRFWQPLMERADQSWLGRMVTSGFSCRGVAGYHMREGLRAKRIGRDRR